MLHFGLSPPSPPPTRGGSAGKTGTSPSRTAGRLSSCPHVSSAPAGPVGSSQEHAAGPGTHPRTDLTFQVDRWTRSSLPCEGVGGVTCSMSRTPSSHPGSPSRTPPPADVRLPSRLGPAAALRRRQHPSADFPPPSPSSGDLGVTPSALQQTLRLHQARRACPSPRLPPSLLGR